MGEGQGYVDLEELRLEEKLGRRCVGELRRGFRRFEIERKGRERGLDYTFAGGAPLCRV
jgi:hypothetical protein